MAELRYRCIVFDWDGTLQDSTVTIAESIQRAAADLGLRVPDRETASHVIGLGLHESLRYAVPDLDPARAMEFAAAYRRHFLLREPQMPLFPGVPEMLARLRERGHMLAVATGKSRRGLDRAFGSTGVGRWFSASRCADETAPKPDPAMLLELMTQFEAVSADVLMIGDTVHDLMMAQAAGVDAVAVSYGAHPEAGLRRHAPAGLAASVEELSAWLSENA